jgi:hypothetical protein
MANLLRIWKTEGGFRIDGTDYQIDDFDNVNFTYSGLKHIMRGANGKNKIGIDTREGMKTPDKAIMNVVDCSTEIYDLLLDAYKNDTRIDLYFIDSGNLGKITFNSAKITTVPRQVGIGEEDSNLSFSLSVESFNVEFGG